MLYLSSSHQKEMGWRSHCLLWVVVDTDGGSAAFTTTGTGVLDLYRVERPHNGPKGYGIDALMYMVFLISSWWLNQPTWKIVVKLDIFAK